MRIAYGQKTQKKTIPEYEKTTHKTIHKENNS